MHFPFLIPRSSFLDNDTDGEEVVYPLEGALLFLHLLPDGVYGLGASLDMEGDACLFQTFLNRLDETFDVGVAAFLRLAQLVLDMIVGIVFKILQRQVFQFTLQLIETQFVSQWGIEVGRLL